MLVEVDLDQELLVDQTHLFFVQLQLVEEHKLVELLEQVDRDQEVVMARHNAEQQVTQEVIHPLKEMLVVMEYSINVILTLVVAAVALVVLVLMAQKHLTQLVQLAEVMEETELMFLLTFQECLTQEYMQVAAEVEFFHLVHLMEQ